MRCSSAIRWSKNVIPLLELPHSPELNPIERLWQFLKQPLKNELFFDLQALRVDAFALAKPLEEKRFEEKRLVVRGSVSEREDIAFNNCLINLRLNKLCLSILITLS